MVGIFAKLSLDYTVLLQEGHPAAYRAFSHLEGLGDLGVGNWTGLECSAAGVIKTLLFEPSKQVDENRNLTC